ACIAKTTGRHTEDQTAQLSQKFLTLVIQIVMILIEFLVQKKPLQETHICVIEPVKAVETVKDTAHERELIVVLERLVLKLFLAKDQPAQEVSVFIGQRAEFVIGLEPLDISLDHGRVAVHGLD